MAAARAVVERHLEQDRPVYGLTTGLGARATHRLPREVLSEFSRLTILGRSNAVGPRLPRDVVRALMLVRLNGLLAGGAGAAPAVAEAIAALLARGLTPVMPSIGSIGAGDLCVLAHLGLALIGEGEIEVEGRARPAAEALADAGLAPLTLGPKDGLAICNASAYSAGQAALALADARAAYETAQIAAALSMEGFRANLSRPGCAGSSPAARSPSRAPRAACRTRSPCAASARSTAASEPRSPSPGRRSTPSSTAPPTTLWS
jgi:histidine ammonia-lyase